MRDDTARDLFPPIHPMGYQTAVRAALVRPRHGRGRDALGRRPGTSYGGVRPRVLTTQEGKLSSAASAWCRGAGRGLRGAAHHRRPARLLAWDWAWELRGAADRLVGGVGLRRGRRDPDDLRAGDALDFWRVEAVEPGACSACARR